MRQQQKMESRSVTSLGRLPSQNRYSIVSKVVGFFILETPNFGRFWCITLKLKDLINCKYKMDQR